MFLGFVLDVVSQREEVEHLVEHGVVFGVLLFGVDFKGATTLSKL